MKKIVTALASVLLVTTAFAQTAAPSDAGKAQMKANSEKNATIVHAMEEVKGRGVPAWLTFDGA